MTSILFHNLGESYDAFVASTLQAVRDTEPEFDTIVYQLLDEEQRKQNRDSTALFTKGKRTGQRQPVLGQQSLQIHNTLQEASNRRPAIIATNLVMSRQITGFYILRSSRANLEKI